MDTCLECGQPLTGLQEKWCCEAHRKRAFRRGYPLKMSYDGELPKPKLHLPEIEDDSPMTELTKIKLGLIADPHFCSKWQQPSNLWDFYFFAYDQGVREVWCCGDLGDGLHMRAGHEYELFKHGLKAHKDYVVENYPKLSGLKTVMFVGNHDWDYWRNAGEDFVGEVCDKREDLVYGGGLDVEETRKVGTEKGQTKLLPNTDISFVKWGVNFKIVHPSDSPTHYTNTKLQQQTEKIPPEEKPDILIQGHYHRPHVIPSHHGVVGIQLPCFQGRTSFFKKKFMWPVIGGCILELWVDQGGLRRWRTEFKISKEMLNDF